MGRAGFPCQTKTQEDSEIETELAAANVESTLSDSFAS
jgi:hypothetical protein